MKPLPPPPVPGSPDAERMSSALRMVLAVSKKGILKEEAKQKWAKERRRAKKHAPGHRLSRRLQATASNLEL